MIIHTKYIFRFSSVHGQRYQFNMIFLILGLKRHFSCRKIYNLVNN